MSGARWTRVPEDDAAAWTSLVEQAADANLFQTAAWAEHKRPAGWTAERWVASGQGGRPLAALQVLLKRLPLGRTVGWAAGGPLTGFSGTGPEEAAELARAWLSQFRSRGGVYVRFRSHRAADPAWVEAFGRVLSRPRTKLNSGVTLELEPGRPLEASKGHRYYVRQAQKAGLAWESGSGAGLAAEFAVLYRELAQAKGLEGRLFDAATLPRLVHLFGDHALVLIGRLGGAPATGCLVLRAGGNAFYLAAATSAEGRKVSAAYAMVPKLLELLSERGVRRLDFGGIDPRNPDAKGVDHFKKGFGGAPLEYLGEWDWAAYPGLRRLADALMRARAA